MVIETYEHLWNLKQVTQSKNKKPNNYLRAQALATYLSLIHDFPKQETRLGSFVGNHIGGNILFNIFIEELSNLNKLKTRCARISFVEFDYNTIRSFYGMRFDVVLIDHVEPSIIPVTERYKIIQLIEGLYTRSNFLFLNIPTEDEHIMLPKSIDNELEASPYNFWVGINAN
jgi:hypothetical protein